MAYIEQMLTLGGVQDAAKKARGIMEFETALAKVQWPLEKRRDAEANYNPRSKAQLLAYAPGFDWQAFFDAVRRRRARELRARSAHRDS